MNGSCQAEQISVLLYLSVSYPGRENRSCLLFSLL